MKTKVFKENLIINKMKKGINWNEQNKIRVRESGKSQEKHLIVKALIMLHLKIKHKKDSHWVKIYSEWPVMEGTICDIYYENIRKKEAFAYEIQKNNSKTWINETNKKYKDWNVYGMKTSDYVIVDLNKLSDDIEELGKQIKELVF